MHFRFRSSQGIDIINIVQTERLRAHHRRRRPCRSQLSIVGKRCVCILPISHFRHPEDRKNRSTLLVLHSGLMCISYILFKSSACSCLSYRFHGGGDSAVTITVKYSDPSHLKLRANRKRGLNKILLVSRPRTVVPISPNALKDQSLAVKSSSYSKCCEVRYKVLSWR